jgi:hypothetical protein
MLAALPGVAENCSRWYADKVENPNATQTVSLPGIIGTGASPRGLPGDDPAQPGFPRKVGR